MTDHYAQVHVLAQFTQLEHELGLIFREIFFHSTPKLRHIPLFRFKNFEPRRKRPKPNNSFKLQPRQPVYDSTSLTQERVVELINFSFELMPPKGKNRGMPDG